MVGFKSIIGETFALDTLVFILLTGFACGLVISFVNYFLSTRSKNMFVTVSVLPMIVSVVVIMVNGIIAVGTGIAIAGAFALVRFRSVPGTAKEILAVFFSMSVGIVCGLGYIGFAFVMTGIVSAVIVILSLTPFGRESQNAKDLKITIAETLDYTDIFNDIFLVYTRSIRLEKIKTINLGSMYELKYRVTLKNNKQEKEFIDAIRTRNGNLTVILSRAALRDELTL